MQKRRQAVGQYLGWLASQFEQVLPIGLRLEQKRLNTPCPHPGHLGLGLWALGHPGYHGYHGSWGIRWYGALWALGPGPAGLPRAWAGGVGDGPGGAWVPWVWGPWDGSGPLGPPGYPWHHGHLGLGIHGYPYGDPGLPTGSWATLGSLPGRPIFPWRPPWGPPYFSIL